MKPLTAAVAIGGVIGGGGFILIGLWVGWVPAAGLFLAIFGNNIQQAAMRGDFNGKP